MSNERPVTAADLVQYHVFGMPLLKLLGLLIVASATATLAYELLF